MGWVLKFSIFSFLLITLSATPTSERYARRYMIVWNVGQGQWVTSVEEFTCRHFDVGGERFPWKKIAHLCRDKKNLIYLSHWDWDHIGGLARWPSSWETCVALRPQGTSSPGKMKMLASFKDCKEELAMPVWRGASNSFEKSRYRMKQNTNALSQVLNFSGFLIPGDSPIQSERTWMKLPWVSSSQILILGHHGSRNSTSEELLESLPSLKMAIASARYTRYKHPHAEVIRRLEIRHIPLLKTEDWGNIWMEK